MVWQQKEKFLNPSDQNLVSVVPTAIHQEVQGGGYCPCSDGPGERQGQQGIGGEQSEEDIPGVIGFSPAENTDQYLDGLRHPGDH